MSPLLGPKGRLLGSPSPRGLGFAPLAAGGGGGGGGEFVGSASGTATSSPLTVDVSALSLESGDIFIAAVAGANSTADPPTGWTTLFTGEVAQTSLIPDGTGDESYRVFTGTSDGTETSISIPGTYSFSGEQAAAVGVFRNVQIIGQDIQSGVTTPSITTEDGHPLFIAVGNSLDTTTSVFTGWDVGPTDESANQANATILSGNRTASGTTSGTYSAEPADDYTWAVAVALGAPA